MIKNILLSILIASMPAVAQNPSNTMKFGQGDSDKTIIFNRASSSKPKIKWSESAAALQFSNDGTNFSDLGSGSGGGSGFNVLLNPDFEGGIAQGWTNTGGTFAHVTSGSNLLFGKGSATFVGGSGNFVQSSLYTIPNGLTGANCSAGMWYKGGDANLAFRVEDGSSNVLVTRTLVAASVATAINLSFPCPASGSFRVKLIGSAVFSTIAFDRMSLGDSALVALSQATYVGGTLFDGATSCFFQGSSGTFANYSADSDCSAPVNSGSASQSTKIPATTFASLSPGEYYVIFQGAMTSDTAAADCQYRIHDGTTGGVPVEVSSVNAGTAGVVTGRFSYSSAQSNKTFQIQAQRNAGAGNCSIYVDTTGARQASMSVYKFPTVQEQGLKIDQVANSWSGYHDGDCAWDFTTGTLADPADDASCTFTERVNNNFGTVSSFGSKKPGIVFTPSRVGTYEVCAVIGAYGQTTNALGNFQLWDGTTVVATAQPPAPGTGATNNYTTTTLCGLYKATSVSPVSLRLRGATSGVAHSITTGTDANTNSKPIEWIIKQIDYSIPAPLIVNTVTSPSNGVEVMTRAAFGDAGSLTSPATCTSTPCVIYTQTASWLSGVVRNGTGDYTATYAAGTFSSPPICVANNLAAATLVNCEVGSLTSSTFNVLCRLNNTPTDAAVSLICMGPK